MNRPQLIYKTGIIIDCKTEVRSIAWKVQANPAFLSLCTSTVVLDAFSENFLQISAAEPNEPGPDLENCVRAEFSRHAVSRFCSD